MKFKRLTVVDVWALALTDDVELRGRNVFHRDSDADETEPMTFAGTLAESVTEEAFYREVADAYSK